jgi:hypothetical protein
MILVGRETEGGGRLVIHELYPSDGFSAHAQAVLYVEGRCNVVSEDFDCFLHRVECFPAQIL